MHFFFILSQTFFFKKKINFFTLYHNLSNINLSPLNYLEKDKIYIHNYRNAKHNKIHTTLIK